MPILVCDYWLVIPNVARTCSPQHIFLVKKWKRYLPLPLLYKCLQTSLICLCGNILLTAPLDYVLNVNWHLFRMSSIVMGWVIRYMMYDYDVWYMPNPFSFFCAFQASVACCECLLYPRVQMAGMHLVHPLILHKYMYACAYRHILVSYYPPS